MKPPRKWERPVSKGLKKVTISDPAPPLQRVLNLYPRAQSKYSLSAGPRRLPTLSDARSSERSLRDAEEDPSYASFRWKGEKKSPFVPSPSTNSSMVFPPITSPNSEQVQPSELEPLVTAETTAFEETPVVPALRAPMQFHLEQPFRVEEEDDIVETESVIPTARTSRTSSDGYQGQYDADASPVTAMLSRSSSRGKLLSRRPSWDRSIRHTILQPVDDFEDTDFKLGSLAPVLSEREETYSRTNSISTNFYTPQDSYLRLRGEGITLNLERRTKVDMAECSRDWNTQFQLLLEEPCFSPMEARSRGEAVRKLCNEFTAAILPVAETIILERSCVNKSIMPLNTDGESREWGRAGGDKYVLGNCFFKFCNTPDTEKLYGGYENSIKSASHELKGVNAIIHSNIQSLHVPLTAVVTFLGHRLFVAARIPINQTTLVYGSSDAARTVVVKNQAKPIVKAAARVLNLKEHFVGRRGAELQELFTPVDMEIHQPEDGRFYVVDTHRMFPPDQNLFLRPQQGSRLFRLLRPEFVRRYNFPLSSDALSAFGHHNRQEHDSEVLQAAKDLLDYAIPEFVRDLPNRLSYRTGFKTNAPITAMMHSAGINMRYCGRVLEEYLGAQRTTELGKQTIVTHLVAEIVARAFKVLALSRLRNEVAKLAEPDMRVCFNLITELFNSLLCGTRDSEWFWSHDVLPEVKKKFNCSAKTEEIILSAASKSTMISLLHPSTLFLIHMRCNDLLGISWKIDTAGDSIFHDRLGTGKQSRIFHMALLMDIAPVVKVCDVSPFSQVEDLIELHRLDEAEKLYKEELKIRHACIGDVPQLVPLLNNLVTLYTKAGWKTSKAQDAIRLKRRVVKIYQNVMAESPKRYSLQYVESLTELGELMVMCGEANAALKVLSTANEYNNQYLSVSHPAAAKMHHVWGTAWHEMGEYGKSLKSFEASFTIYRKLYERKGVKNAAFNFATSIARAGIEASICGHKKRALSYTAEALSVSANCEMPDAILASIELYSITVAVEGWSYCGEFEKAIPEAERCIQRLRDTVGTKNEDVARGLMTLSKLKQMEGEMQQGLRLCEESLSISEDIFGHDSLQAGECLFELAQFNFSPFIEPPLDKLASQDVPKRYLLANSYLQQGLQKIEARRGTDFPSYARGLTLQADLIRITRIDTLSAASDMARRAKGIYEFHSLLSSPEYVMTINLEAQLNMMQGVPGAHCLPELYRALSVSDRNMSVAGADFVSMNSIAQASGSKGTKTISSEDALTRELEANLHLAATYLHGKEPQHTAQTVRKIMILYKDVRGQFVGGMEPMVHRMGQLAKALTAGGALSHVGEVGRVLERLVDQEKQNIAQYEEEKKKHEIESGIGKAKKQQESLRLRLTTQLKQVRNFATYQQHRNAVNLLHAAVRQFGELYPGGATKVVPHSIECHNTIVGLIRLLQPKVQAGADQDVHLSMGSLLQLAGMILRDLEPLGEDFTEFESEHVNMFDQLGSFAMPTSPTGSQSKNAYDVDRHPLGATEVESNVGDDPLNSSMDSEYFD